MFGKKNVFLCVKYYSIFPG